MNDLDALTEVVMPGEELNRFSDDVWRLLLTADSEFVPPLSAREDTTEQQLTGFGAAAGPVAYFESMMLQPAVVMRIGDAVGGVLSFRSSYVDPLVEQWSPSLYVSTIVVAPEFRGRHVGRGLVDRFVQFGQTAAENWMVTRTWSSNLASRRLFGGSGFHEVVRMRDHRGEAEDTLYLVRANEPRHVVAT